MSTRLERFQKRKKIKKSITVTETNASVTDISNKFLNSNLDETKPLWTKSP